MKFTKEQKEMLDKFFQNKKQEEVEFGLSSHCHGVKKLTDTYVIFKSCFCKSEIKYYFDLDDMDDVLLRYMLFKNRKSHYMVRQRLFVWDDSKKKKRNYSEEEIKECIREFVRLFGKVYASEVAEYLGTSPRKVTVIIAKMNNAEKEAAKK